MASFEIKDLENSTLSLEEKLLKVRSFLTSSKTIKPQLFHDLLIWFIKTKDDLLRTNASNDDIELVYKTLCQCMKASHIGHIPIYQMKLNMMSNLIQLLNIREQSISKETFIQCCLSILSQDNFVKCLEGDALMFTKFSKCTNWIFSIPITTESTKLQPEFSEEKILLLDKLVGILKKVKWNSDFGLQDLTDALVCIATLDNWNNTWQKENDSIKLILEQVFYSVVTKDGSLCGILLTSFHDESILMKQEYSNIFNILSLLHVIPTQHEAYISGKIYSLLLKTTHKLSEDYFGNISFVFEKLDSLIRIKIKEYEINGRRVLNTPEKITSITPFKRVDHWFKMVHILKNMTQFLVDNNISSNLPINNAESGSTLEDLCTGIAKCVMFMVGILQTQQNPTPIANLTIVESYSVLLSIFSFAPHIAIKTFSFFKSFVIQTQVKAYQPYTAAMYGQVFATVLNIHFKLSYEVKFLETLFRFADLTDEYVVSNCGSWLPDSSYRSTLHKTVSSVSSERILSGWLNCIVAHFNVDALSENLSLNNYHMYCICTSLSITLEVTLVKEASTSSETEASLKRNQLLNDIKRQLGKINVLLDLDKKNELLFSSILQVCVCWGAFQIMCNEYQDDRFKSDLSLQPGDPAVYVLHNYLTIDEWNKISRIVTTHHKESIPVMGAWSELFVQVLDMLYFYHNVNDTSTPEENTAEFLVEKSHCSWLLGRAHLLQAYLSFPTQWKLAYKLSLYLVENDDGQKCLEDNNQLYELNVQVFGIAFHTLKKAIQIISSKVLEILNMNEKEILKLVFKEDSNISQGKRESLTKTNQSSDDNDTSNDETSEEEEAEKSELKKNTHDKESKRKRKTKDNNCDDKDSDESVDKKKKKDGSTFMKKKDVDSEDTGSTKETKRRKLMKEINVNDLLVKFLVDNIESDEDYVSDVSEAVGKCLSIVQVLPVQYLEVDSQQLLFLLVLICCRASTKTRPIINRFLLSKNFSLPSSEVIPYLLKWICDFTFNIYAEETLTCLCELIVQDEHAIKVFSKSCELVKKNTDKINVDLLPTQSQMTYHFLNELNQVNKKKTNKPITELKKKIINRAHTNFKNLALKSTEDTLPLFEFMLHISLKGSDGKSIDELCTHLNAYLDLALAVKNIRLIKLILTYSDLTLKKYMPPEFIPKVWKELPSCANLCFQSASLDQFNGFLHEMCKQTETLLAFSKTSSCDMGLLHSNFDLWRNLLTSHLSVKKNVARLAKLETLVSCLSTHVTLYRGQDTRHFPFILQLVLDTIHSPVFTCNISVVHFLFNLITPKSCVYFKCCIKILQYLITKKASTISDETALFLLKYHCLLSQIARHVSSPKCQDGESDILLIAMEKVAHAIRKEKKYFQRVAPYMLSNIMNLYLTNKFPLGVTVHMNEVSYIFISICDEHGLNLLKHSLPESSKQVFLKTLQNYTKYSSQRFL